MAHADGQNPKAPREGDLIFIAGGIPLVVLGIPDTRGDDDRWGRMLEGVIVVLMPDGKPALHLITIPKTRRPFLSPWDGGWLPIPPGWPPEGSWIS
jgi:hypothetical protein